MNRRFPTLTVLFAAILAQVVLSAPAQAGSLKPKTEVDTPVITPTGGHYDINAPVMVSIRAESGARIVYTLDGTIPTPGWGIQCDSNLIFIELPPGDVTVRAIAVKSGLPPSRTARAKFTRSAGSGG